MLPIQQLYTVSSNRRLLQGKELNYLISSRKTDENRESIRAAVREINVLATPSTGKKQPCRSFVFHTPYCSEKNEQQINILYLLF